MGIPGGLSRGDALDREIAAAMPADPLGDRVCAVAFLHALGRGPSPVTVGGYELERCLGGGAFGRVYLARQPKLRRRVAVKVLRADRAYGGMASLRAEAAALAQLNHPNVVRVYQIGEAPEGAFIVMEYVAGRSLHRWQSERDWVDVLVAYRQAGLGLAAAHERAILHLDFKPSNVLMGDDGRVRVVDFGLARTFADLDEEGSEGVGRARGGTLGYAAPEHVAARRVDAAADQFSYCASLYEAMHGVLPYRWVEIAEGRLHRQPRRGDRRCPRWVDDVLVRGLLPNPHDRWSSMNALVEALDPRARRSKRLVTISAVALASPVLALVADRSSDDACAVLVDSLAPAWSERERAEVQGALVAAGHGWTPALVSTMLETLDVAAREVDDAAFGLCRASLPPPEYVAVRDCIARRRERLDHAVTRLADGDVRLAEHADAWATELAQPLGCDATNGAGRTDTAERRELLDALDLVRVDIAAGTSHDAPRRAEQLVATARALGEPEAVATALLVRGLARTATGFPEQALADLEESAELAIAAGRDDLVAESSRRAGTIAADAIDDVPRGERWMRVSRAAVERLGTPPRLAVLLLDDEGRVARLRGDTEAALALHRQSIALRERLGVEAASAGTAWMLLAHAHADREELVEAAAAYTRALELVHARLGEQHPQAASILQARAVLARDATAVGDNSWLERAARDLDVAASILRDAATRDELHIAAVAMLRAEVSVLAGELDAAESLAREALAIHADRLPRLHPERGSALVPLIQVAAMRADWPRVLALTLEYADLRDGIDDEEIVAIRDNNIGWLLARLGRYREARSYYTRAVASPSPRQQSYARGGLAYLELVNGDPTVARRRLGDVLASVEALGDDAPPDQLAELRWHLALAMIATAEPPAATTDLVARALEFYRASNSDRDALASLEQLEAAARPRQ